MAGHLLRRCAGARLPPRPKGVISAFDPVAILLGINLDVEGLNVGRYHPVITNDKYRITQFLKRKVLTCVFEQDTRRFAIGEDGGAESEQYPLAVGKCLGVVQRALGDCNKLVRTNACGLCN